MIIVFTSQNLFQPGAGLIPVKMKVVPNRIYSILLFAGPNMRFLQFTWIHHDAPIECRTEKHHNQAEEK
jgi:hypothetical protein